MDPISIAALVLAALMYGGTTLYNGIQTKRDRKLAMEMQEDAQAHEELMQKKQMEYNSYPNQVSMMKEAGVNPALMYGMSGSLQSVSAGSTGSGALGHIPSAIPMQQPNENMMQAAMSIMATKANIAQSEAMTKKAMAELPFLDAQTKKELNLAGLYSIQQHGQKIQNQLSFKDLQYRDIQNQLDIMAKRAGIAQTSALAKKYISDATLNDLQGKFTQVQINQAAFALDKEKQIWDDCADYIIRGIKEETRGKVMNAEKLFYEAKELMYKTGQMDEVGAYTGANGFFGTGLTVPLLTEIISDRASQLKGLAGEEFAKFKQRFQDLLSNVAEKRSSAASEKKVFRTPSELWNDDVINGTNR